MVKPKLWIEQMSFVNIYEINAKMHTPVARCGAISELKRAHLYIGNAAQHAPHFTIQTCTMKRCNVLSNI